MLSIYYEARVTEKTVHKSTKKRNMLAEDFSWQIENNWKCVAIGRCSNAAKPQNLKVYAYNTFKDRDSHFRDPTKKFVSLTDAKPQRQLPKVYLPIGLEINFHYVFLSSNSAIHLISKLFLATSCYAPLRQSFGDSGFLDSFTIMTTFHFLIFSRIKMTAYAVLQTYINHFFLKVFKVAWSCVKAHC